MTIWKFDVSIDDSFVLSMPMGARPVSVQMQCDKPCLWAIVDELRPVEQRRFYIVGTGHDIPRRAAYVGTFQQHGGMLVWHLFEAKP